MNQWATILGKQMIWKIKSKGKKARFMNWNRLSMNSIDK